MCLINAARHPLERIEWHSSILTTGRLSPTCDYICNFRAFELASWPPEGGENFTVARERIDKITQSLWASFNNCLRMRFMGLFFLRENTMRASHHHDRPPHQLTITERERGFATVSRQVREDDGSAVPLVVAERLVFGSWRNLQDQHEWTSVYRRQSERLVS